MPNENIMGVPTRACINGLTKEDTDRLKNALIKKIEDDETTVDITEDGKIILANENNLFLSFDGNILGITKDASGDYIPWTVPYLPEDENENPLAPPNDVIMTSANIGVDPRIVHTTGNEEIAGNKLFSGTINIPKLRSASVAVQMNVNTWYKMYVLTPVSVGQQIFFDIFNTSSISSLVDAKLRIQIPNSNFPYDPAGNLFNVGSILVGKLAKTNDGKIEVWLSKVSGSAQYIMLNVEYVDFLIPTPIGTSGNEPVQGADYPLVKDLTVIS